MKTSFYSVRMAKTYTGVILAALILLGCTRNKKNPAVAQYIEQVTKSSLPESTTIYVLIPFNQCKNCILFDRNNLPSQIKDRVVVISSFPQSHFKNFNRYYHDPSDAMLRLKDLDYGNKFVIVEHSEIKSIINLTDFDKQTDSLKQLTLVK